MGKTAMKFTGKLAIFNNNSLKATEKRVAFLSNNANEIEIDKVDLEQLVSWLMLEVSNNGDEVNKAWKDLYEFVKKNESHFIKLCKDSIDDKDAVADFLTEVLRICNFAQHSKQIIGNFRKIMTTCGIVIVGEPGLCTSLTTFEKLGYDRTSHQVTMDPGNRPGAS